MRKLLSIAALFLGGVVFAQEPITTFAGNDGFHFVGHKDPSTVAFAIVEGDYYEKTDAEQTITILNRSFETVKSFSVPTVTASAYYKYEERAVSGLTQYYCSSEELYDLSITNSDSTYYEALQGKDPATVKSLLELYYGIELEQRECVCKYDEFLSSSTGKIDFCVTNVNENSQYPFYYGLDDAYYYYAEYGTKYPEVYFHFEYDESGVSHTYLIHSAGYETAYMGEWEAIDSIPNGESSSSGFTRGAASIELCNTNITTGDYISLYVTCDVFDDDETTYEVLMPRYEQGEFELYNEEDRDDNGEPDYRKYQSAPKLVGWDIYSDGVKIGALNVDGLRNNYNEMCLYVVDNNVYIRVFGYDEEANYIEKIYRYDAPTTAVQALHEYKSSGVRMRNDIVEIELAQECGNGTELMVTSLSGQQCVRRQVPAGSKSVTVDTRTLSAGVYNFTVLSGGKVVENGKVVVR